MNAEQLRRIGMSPDVGFEVDQDDFDFLAQLVKERQEKESRKKNLDPAIEAEKPIVQK